MLDQRKAQLAIVEDYPSVGNTRSSDPTTSEGDERAFCLVRSKWLQAPA